MAESILRLIQTGDSAALLALLLSGQAGAAPDGEKRQWAWEAASLGRADMLRLLCERCHALPLGPDAQGRTLLHAAMEACDRDTVSFLLHTLGMDPLAGDDSGVTPLELAAREEKKLALLEELSGIRLRDCYQNPVMRGFRPDPSIVRVGEDYWMVHSSFVLLPALPISHSRDLVHWETAGHVFTDPETARLEGLPGGFGYWAPDISYDGSRYWVTATLRRNEAPFRLQMVTWAPSPLGPWAKPKFLDVDGIDPSLFMDSDGQRYLVINPGVQIAPLSDTGDLLSAPRMIWYGWNRRKSEGPHLLKKDGWYYIFQAEGGTGAGHMVSCSRSRSLYGPYQPCPFNPILGSKREGAFIRRSGHGKPVQLPDGRWAMVYLCSRGVEGKSLMGRETGLDPMTWTADGWPMVNNLQGPSCLQKRPLPPCPLPENEPWICPRADWTAFASLGPGGSIDMAGGKELGHMRDAHLLLRRQTEAVFSQSASVDVDGMDTGGMAGLTGYYDENSFYFLALRKKDRGADVILLEQIGPEAKETLLGSLDGHQAALALHGRGLDRAAGCAGLENTVSFRADYLTDEGLKIGKRFTGALLGLAAQGGGRARFQDYREEMCHERA